MDSVKNWWDIYSWLWTIRDRRVDDWMLLESIKPMVFFLTLYFAAVIYGPVWMIKRQPFKLKWIIFAYNLYIAVLNLHVFKELAIVSYRQGYNWWCEPVRVSTDPEEMRILAALHYYLMSKVIELLDTVFIVARKKNNQLTFLHVYHHSTMLVLCWCIGRWVPGGNAVLGALTNAFVHVVMYSYYCASVLGPDVARYLWWKRYLTILQLVQFMMGFVVGVHMFVFGCQYTKWMQYVAVFYMSSYLFLFGRFYVSSYGNRRTKRLMSDENVSQRLDQPLSSSDVRHRQVNSTSPRSLEVD